METVLRKNYEVLTAANGIDALEILRNKKVSLLISDQRMKGMTGVELLRESQSLDPDLVRMLVTASTDNDTSLQAINDAGALRVIHKPFDPRRVLQFVEEARAHRETLIECKYTNAEVAKVIQQLQSKQLEWNGLPSAND
jgi:DNA-binding NtrC family response regulator